MARVAVPSLLQSELYSVGNTVGFMCILALCWPEMPSLRAGPSLRCPLLKRAPPFPSPWHLGYLDNYS